MQPRSLDSLLGQYQPCVEAPSGLCLFRCPLEYVRLTESGLSSKGIKNGPQVRQFLKQIVSHAAFKSRQYFVGLLKQLQPQQARQLVACSNTDSELTPFGVCQCGYQIPNQFLAHDVFGHGQYFAFSGNTHRTPPRGSGWSPLYRGIRWMCRCGTVCPAAGPSLMPML